MRRAALLAGVLASCATPPFDRPPGPPSIERFDALPFRARPGDRITISWRVSRAESVALIEGGADPQEMPLEGEIVRSYESTTPLVLVARGPGGERRARVDVLVEPVPAVEIVRFEVDPPVAAPGDPVLVHWETKNAALVVITADPGGEVEREPPLSGRLQLHPERDVRLVLRAEGPGGPAIASRTILVRVDPPVIEVFTIAPPVIQFYDQAQVSWVARGATSVALFISENGAPERPLLAITGAMGAVVIGGAPGSIELTLEARGPGGVTRERGSLRVLDTDPPEVLSLTLSQARTGPGGQVVARFASRNATQVRVLFGGSQVAVLAGGEGSVTLGSPPAGAYDIEAVAFDARARQSDVASVRMTVDRSMPEALRFSADPSVFVPGQPVSVSWSLLRADRVTVTSDLGAVLTTTTATAGAFQLLPDGPQVLTLEAENASGITRRYATLEPR